MGNIDSLMLCCVRKSQSKCKGSTPETKFKSNQNTAEPTQEFYFDTNASHAENPQNIPLNQKTQSEEEEEMFNDPTFLYQKSDFLGVGSHGTVFESMSINDGNFYACKYISCKSDCRKQIALYLDQKIMDINHENTVKYIEIAESPCNDQDLMIVSELVSGGPLNKLINNVKVLDEKICKLFTKQILQALIYLNNQGFSHSNLKTSNIMVEVNGVIKLNDFFTISRKIISQNPENQILRKNNICYIAPEIITLEKKTLSSDIWSLGCILLEIMTGVKPWGENYNNIEFISNELKNGNLPNIPENLSIAAVNFLKKLLVINYEIRSLASNLINDPFLLEINEKEEDFALNKKDVDQIKMIKSLFNNNMSQNKDDNNIAMAKNLFYQKIYEKTMAKNENLEEIKSSHKGSIRGSFVESRKKKEEERKIFEKEMKELFKENN